MQQDTSKPLKVVQVGCGGMGRGWIANAVQIPELQLVGLVDVQRKAAEAAAAASGLSPGVVFDTLAEALAKTDADVVFDVTVPSAHESVVVEALQHRRHVLGEKPMSDSLESAKRMVAAAKKSGKTYAVTQNYRYNPAIRSLQSFVARGAIGPVQEAHAEFYLGAHFSGPGGNFNFRDEMAYPLILDMSIHTFDAARFLTGADPVSVYCHSFNPARSWYKGDASAIAIFEMSDGIVFSYRGSWCAEGLNTSWNSTWRILGGKGTVHWSGGDTFQAEAVKPGAPAAFTLEQEPLTVPIIPMNRTSHAALMDQFVACIREGKKPETDCEDNIKSLAMVLAAVESAKTGRKVPVVW